MAEKYLLQVTAGPSYAPETHKIVKVNDPVPLRISNELGDINLRVRIQNYRGLPRNSPTTSSYFSQPPHTNDQYSICFDFVPKKPIPGEKLIFGNDFDRSIADRLPPGFGAALKFVKWAIDPGLDGDPYADKPYLYSPALSTFNIFHIGEKIATLPDVEKLEDGVLEEGALGDGQAIREKGAIPADAPGRKKYFLNEEKRKEFEFEAGRQYSFDFFNPYLDFNEFALKMGVFNIPVIGIFENKKMPLRYVLLNKDTKQVYFVVVITLLVKADVEQDEAHAIAEEKFKKDGEGAFQDDDDGVD